MNHIMGLVLSCTDNATSNINRVADALSNLTRIAENTSSSLKIESLSAIRDATDRLGNSVLRVGSGILSTFSSVIGEVNKTGQTLMYAEKQLNALYAKSGKSGKKVISQIQEYAEKSMFEFENLIPAVTSLKSVGIEAFDSITSSQGNATYSLLDYASALASFAPQMRNAYGTGINAAIGAMREYIAEGNKLSLKRGAGLDITAIIGEEKGTTIEDRTRQVADLIETLGMLGMVDAMKESPMVKLSNMGDVLFKFKGMVSDSGVYQAINGLIDIFADFVTGISDERLQNIAKTVGGALTSLIKPVKLLSKWIVSLADGFLKLVENNPLLAQFITIVVAVGGVFTILVGILLKLASAFSGVSLLFLTFGKSFSKFGTLFKSGASLLFGKIKALLPTFALLYTVWKTDFGGIRTLLSSFLDDTGSFVRKIVDTVALIIDAWDFELSEENFQKAKEMGILPLIESILDLKYKFGFFKKGFVDGWNEISEKLSTVITGFVEQIEGIPIFEPLVKGLTDFIELLNNGDTEEWYKFGESFGKFVANALTLWLIFKGIGIAISIIGKFIGIVTKVFGFITKVFGIIGKVFGIIIKFGGAILSVIGTIVTAILGFFGIVVSAPAWVVGAITVAIVAIIALIVKFWDEICAFFSMIGTWIYDNVIKPVADFFVGLWEGIVTGVKNFVEAVKSVFFTIVGWINDNIITPIANFFTGLWEKIQFAFQTVADTVSSVFKAVVNTVFRFIGNVINGVIKGINAAISLINAIPGVNITKITELKIPQLAQGGVVDRPTTALIGEAGTEMVLPIEKNTEWIGVLAKMLTSEMHSISPTNSRMTSIAPQKKAQQSFMTSNNNSHSVVQGDTDNSIVFKEGAIQIIAQNTSDEEALRLAKKIMQFIKRQKELQLMAQYN